jgi:hypothetical protein
MRWDDDIWHCGLTFICFAWPGGFLICRGSDSVGATSEEVSATATWQREHIRSAWRKSMVPCDSDNREATFCLRLGLTRDIIAVLRRACRRVCCARRRESPAKVRLNVFRGNGDRVVTATACATATNVPGALPLRSCTWAAACAEAHQRTTTRTSSPSCSKAGALAL